jgi:predicted RNase H-like nuclease (RuvC/YqgF family)
MSTVAKILVVLNLGLAFFFLASASNFLAQQEDYSNQLTVEKKHHEDDNSTKDAKIAELTQAVKNATHDTQSAQRERDDAQKENGRMSEELTHLRDAFDSTLANATLAQRTVDQLTNSLSAAKAANKALQDDNNNLRTNLRQAQEDRDKKVESVNALQQQLANETEKSKGLEEQLSKAQETIRHQGFVIAYYKDKFPGLTPSAQPAQTGRILAVNNKDNVYVISLGEEDGVKAGFEYIVARGSEYVATIQITDVQAKKAAGRALKALSKGDIHLNDMVMSGN